MNIFFFYFFLYNYFNYLINILVIISQKSSKYALLFPIRLSTNVVPSLSGTAHGTSPQSLLSFTDYISRPPDHRSLVHFQRGEDLRFCPLTIVDDSLFEDAETFRVGLANPLGGRLGKHNGTVITILPDSKDGELVEWTLRYRDVH